MALYFAFHFFKNILYIKNLIIKIIKIIIKFSLYKFLLSEKLKTFFFFYRLNKKNLFF